MKTNSNELRRRRIAELRTIPGVGPSIAEDLLAIGITSVADLAGRDPEELYQASNRVAGVVQDRCLLYTFRCAVYFASTTGPDPELLKWWNWSDERLGQRAGQRPSKRRRPAA